MKLHKILFLFACGIVSVPAFAGWQYNGYYVNDGYYNDDGSRFVIGLRGGLSLANAKMKNEMGNLYSGYYVNPNNNQVISELRYNIADAAGEDVSGFVYAGQGNVGSLPAKEKFSKTAFTAGASVGFTIPYHPQWRLEAGYDYISETHYNENPFLQGDLVLSGGDFLADVNANVSSSSVSATISTDVISAMAYYDFFDGNRKPLNTIIPYIGFGMGYASSHTTLKLIDEYGDLTGVSSLEEYNTAGNQNIWQFDGPSDKSKYPSSNNVALVGAVGVSYGINDYAFFDFGARIMYIPTVKWNLVNSTGTQHREWFSAENMIYTNINVGLRFEF